jgi:hypothetical protein
VRCAPGDRLNWRSAHRVIESLAIAPSGDPASDRAIGDRAIGDRAIGDRAIGDRAIGSGDRIGRSH